MKEVLLGLGVLARRVWLPWAYRLIDLAELRVVPALRRLGCVRASEWLGGWAATWELILMAGGRKELDELLKCEDMMTWEEFMEEMVEWDEALRELEEGHE